MMLTKISKSPWNMFSLRRLNFFVENETIVWNQFRKFSSTATAPEVQEMKPKFRITKLNEASAYYQRYVNYAPVLFEWTQKVVSGKISLDQLVTSKQFQSVSNSICDTIRHSDTNVLKMIKSVIILGLDPSLQLVKFLEDELLFKIEFSFDMRLLISTLNLYKMLKDSTEKRAQIFETLLRRINKVIDQQHDDPTQVINLMNLIQLLKLSRYLTSEIILKLEEQVTKHLDQNEHIELEDLCYLIVLLSRNSRRNKSLIRTVVSHLLKCRPEEIYTLPPHLIHMISSLNRLNFPEINLLEKCSDILINLKFLESIPDSSRRDFTVSISSFNFSYSKLNDYYLQTLIERPDLFKHQDLVTLTITLARLNYQREDLSEIIRQHIWPNCSIENSISKHQWFNYVYSLVLLRCASVDQLKSILENDFYKKMEREEVDSYLRRFQSTDQNDEEVLSIGQQEASQIENDQENFSPSTEGQEVYQVMNIRRKYCNLLGLLELEFDRRCVKHDEDSSLVSNSFNEIFSLPEDREKFLQYCQTFDLGLIKRSKDMKAFYERLVKSFEWFAPSKTAYSQFNVQTPFGFSIDIELIVDEHGKPLVNQNPGAFFKSKNSIQESSDNSENCRRIAFMCIGFNDTLLDNSTAVIGPKEVELSILRSLGYVVIPIHQNSLPPSVTSVNRVKFIENLIQSHLKN